MRTIRLSIAPATAGTCGDKAVRCCQFLRASRTFPRWECRVFRVNSLLAERDGRPVRWPECIEAEEEK
jgi:hypothetical protein